MSPDKSAHKAATKELENLRAFKAAVLEVMSLPLFSPSAPYEARHKAIEKSVYYKADWWNVYPEGHLAALAFRLWRLLRNPGWEEKGYELPWTAGEIRQRMEP